MRTSWRMLAWLGCLLVCSPAGGASLSLPLAIEQDYTTYNLNSAGGVPISNTNNVPPGSNGKMPTGMNESGSVNLPTAGQFQSLLTVGATPGLTRQVWTNLSHSSDLQNGSVAFSGSLAVQMGLPVAQSNSTVVMVLRRAEAGAPFLNRAVSFVFGATIPMPSTAENGLSLTNVVPEDYWLAEPFTTNGHVGDQFYWSSNALQVFATQPGPIYITWEKAAAYSASTLPAYVNQLGAALGTGSFSTNGASIYLLYTVAYVISGSAVKTPQRIYWTYGSFANSGHPVDVPSGRVGAVNVIYNTTVPMSVANAYVDPYQVQPVSSGSEYQETRTIWFDNTSGSDGQIDAYNVEGRVFIELLGAPTGTGLTRQYLGFEIVDIFKEPSPVDVTNYLGERLTAYQEGSDDSALYPSPLSSGSTSFYYEQNPQGSTRPTYYADAATVNLNDFEMYWLDTGVAGLQWPYLFDRYHLVWPSDPSQYTYYLRPQVATAAEAALTSVQLPAAETPTIDYQDPDPTYGPRATLTPEFTFYTFLDPSFPVHRSLLRFNSGPNVAFERVFSWLDTAMDTNAFLAGPVITNTDGSTLSMTFSNSLLASSVATNLVGWNPTNGTLTLSNQLIAPYVLAATVNVGDRIEPPSGELGSDGTYWAGYLLQTSGNSFNPGAYLDPFAVGFEQANQGAIIPVNAIRGSNRLEVWWFRSDNPDLALGFQAVYWPSVIGHYTLQWPANAPQIILASNAGSGPLDSLRAAGSIYYQNDPTQPGYNPNEEHALMVAGQAYALRDDLNSTNATSYSSAPFVLIDYTGADGRPAMSAFQVRREAPELGILFDRIVEAGTLLQAPMPLPLLDPPVVGSGEYAVNYNQEPPANSGDLPVGWNSSFTNGPYGLYQGFTFQDRKHEFWVYRGLHAGLPPLQAGSYNPTNGQFGPLPAATAVKGQPFAYYIHTSRPTASLTLTSPSPMPTGLSLQNTTNGLALIGTPTAPNSSSIPLVIADTADGSVVSNTLALTVASKSTTTVVAQGPLTITSTNQYSGAMATFTNRPPFLAQAPTPTNSFTMHFYYVTLPGFAWPGIADPPAVGSIVPYLRPKNPAGQFVGDPASSNTPSLNIVYRPVWPALVNDQPVPTLFSGQTLTDPANNLAAIRGQSSVQVLYQQSIGLDITGAPRSVVLYDPTVQKTSSLLAQGLSGLPPSVVSQSYEGRDYFQDLPPNLVNRLYYDPDTTNLVFQGQFIDDPLGEKYLLLNVLAGADLEAVRGLCPDSDTVNKPLWVAAVTNLATQVLTFYEDPQVPGSYVANPAATVTRFASDLVQVTNADTQVDSYALCATGPGEGYITYVTGNGRNPAHSGEPVSVYVARVAPMPPPLTPGLYPGELKVITSPNPLSELISFQHTADLAGHSSDYAYDWRIAPPVNGLAPTTTPHTWTVLAQGNDLTHYTLGGPAGVESLSDNYVALRYRNKNPLADPATTNWSSWTAPVLAEGWIKRVLQGINPFDQRTTDLFDNPVNTSVSIIEQAGHRWEGDVALNEDTLNDYGLIEIYETVLHRGEAISIDAGINYGPANDALLLAAGYLSDLYMYIGNDAWANSLNPTISIGTDDPTYGSIATAMFCFEGEVPTLLQQDLALLRGRDDSLSPGVQLNPVYNRLYWNYTYGIAAGEVIYALNYNIQDENNDGVINAADAAILYPMGHGDAYGHYLTALGGFYALLMNQNFDWVPQAEAVTVLGAAVSVNYEHERQFASAAAALARTGRQVFDLTWRQDYQPGTSGGWTYFDTNRVNPDRPYMVGNTTNYVTEYWGLDHWSARVGQGTYLNWVIGNAILPPVDTNPNDQGIQVVDRTTVTELQELPQTGAQLQADMDNAEAGFTPLGLPQNAVAFDIDPLLVTGPNPQTHFEQIYRRAVTALNNAVVAFDDAQTVTEELRSDQDSEATFQAGVQSQELAYTNQLTEIYGTPYPDDIGPGKTYPQGYYGPDLIHYMYVDDPDTNNYGGILPNSSSRTTFKVDIQQLPASWTITDNPANFFTAIAESSSTNYAPGDYVTFNIGPDGFSKPASWTSRRASTGKIQQAINNLIAAKDKLRMELANAVSDKQALDQAMQVFLVQSNAAWGTLSNQQQVLAIQQKINQLAADTSSSQATFSYVETTLDEIWGAATATIPTDMVFGLADGGDLFSGLRGGFLIVYQALRQPFMLASLALAIGSAEQTATWQGNITTLSEDMNQAGFTSTMQNQMATLTSLEGAVQNHLATINQDLTALNNAQNAYNSQVAQGNEVLQERLTFRQHAAVTIQTYRTRDAAFLLFQNEKLERYTTLFNLAAEYAYLAANAYDYETGLLNTEAGKAYLQQIVGSQALGVIEDGQPQFAASDTGDPGLSSALAEMWADWSVLKGRLGFNNPDGYGTTVSLRTENCRVLSTSDGDSNWQDVLQKGRMANLLNDSDVERYCMQIDDGSGLAVPGIVLTFSTTIADGLNLFGQPLAPGDHTFSSSSFATKIFAVGVDFDGYIGMDNPTSGTNTVSPTDPNLDPNALAATPYVYLIPVGVDSMRTPPLGDTSTIRTWNVDDLAIPLPFNVSQADFAGNQFYTSSSSLSEPLFTVRKHQAFRPVSTTAAFNTDIYGAGGSLQPSEYTNKRLIGRSVWNSKWKLVIPGQALLNDPNDGLNRFINSVKDVKLYFITYSYSGN